jgi:molybdopterin molybdotransferase
MISWRGARELAHEQGGAGSRVVVTVPLDRAAGLTLGAEVRGRQAVPRFDNSAMDGWAIAGDGPWRVGEPVLAGSPPPPIPLSPGQARPIATGAPVPPGTLTVLRSEDAIPWVEGAGGMVDSLTLPTEGRDIRREGEEVAVGEVVLGVGARLTPPALGLLAAAEVDEVRVVSPPKVTFVAIGDELGARDSSGRIADSLSPMMPSLISALGGDCAATLTAADDPTRLAEVISRSNTETVVTSGGTAHGPADPVREALRLLGATTLVDGIDLRPGSSVLLAELGHGRRLLALPGNPLAALVDLVVLGWPLLEGLLGRPAPALSPWATPATATTPKIGAADAPGEARRDRAIACTAADGVLTPVGYQRSGMLRGIAQATHLALVSRDGAEVDVLRLPWAAP